MLSNPFCFVGLRPFLDYLYLLTMIAYLRLNGVNAKEHPVFRELTRVKQYFEKTKRAESVGTNKGSMALDKAAAGRFIKHALAGNEPYDIKLAQQNEKTKVAAHIRFVQVAKKRKIEDDQGATQALPSQVSSTSSFESKESTADATVPEIGAQMIVKEGKKKRGKDSKREGKRQQSQPQKKEPDTQG